jgi:hypothetical protein
MSEYQYYEFFAVDRPLGDADLEALRALSSRARLTRTSFTVHYNWGDFKGDPYDLMQRGFDVHVYLANWGTRRLMLRLPAPFLDRARLEPFLQPVDWVEVSTIGQCVLLDFLQDDDEPYDDWDDGTGWLAALAPLREDLLCGDLRVLYLVWLTAVEAGELPEDAPEPLPGIAPLSGALDAFADYFRIDADLVAVAAERESGDRAPSGEAARTQLAALPDDEKTALLQRLVDGDPQVRRELCGRLRQDPGASAPARRTAGELRRRAFARAEARARKEAARREAERQRQAAEAERRRRARLEAVRGRGDDVWCEVEAEIARRHAAGYDRAAELLSDLKQIAVEDGHLDDYTRRLEALRERHGRKRKMMERLDRLRSR